MKKDWLEINHTGPVSGKIEVQGSKNSALGLIAAACLSNNPITLLGIPDLLDFRVIKTMATEIGLRIQNELHNVMIVDPTKIHSTDLNIEITSDFRASYYFIGGLLAKYGRVSIGYPGGDNFGSRPIDQHIKGFQALGAKILYHKDHFVVEATKLKGNEIVFDVITCGATINLLIAAVLAEGKTVLFNAATDPEVVDVANLLNLMGAKVKGAGTSKITIEGVTELNKSCQYHVIPDRLIAGSMLMVPGITGGSITVDNIIPEHLNVCTIKLRELGMEVEVHDNSITSYGGMSLSGTRLQTGMYPSLATDLQQPFTSLLLCANGKSTVTDSVYPKRFAHVSELVKMGADIKVKGNSAYIVGKKPLKGAWVQAADVRAGASLILAALAAEGPTYITGTKHIFRGYEDVIGLFKSVGVTIASKEEFLDIRDTSYMV